MAFCPACGAPADGAFCPKCGGASAVPAVGLPENTAGALCYFGGLVTGIVFLAISPYRENPRIRFHAFQSILFNLAWILGWFALIPLGMLLPLGPSIVLSLCGLLLWGGGVLVWLLLMWKAYQGQALSMPLIGSLAHQQVTK